MSNEELAEKIYCEELFSERDLLEEKYKQLKKENEELKATISTMEITTSELIAQIEKHSKPKQEIAEHCLKCDKFNTHCVGEYEGVSDGCDYHKPKYRPFRNCNELIETWCNLVQKKCDPHREEDYSKNTLSLPKIWVLDNKNGIAHSITDYDLKMNTPNCIKLNGNWKDLEFIFKYCSFLDGSVCGVEE